MGGGSPAAAGPTEGFNPRGVEVTDLGGGETTVFTGVSPTTGKPGVYDIGGNTIVADSQFGAGVEPVERHFDLTGLGVFRDVGQALLDDAVQDGFLFAG